MSNLGRAKRCYVPKCRAENQSLSNLLISVNCLFRQILTCLTYQTHLETPQTVTSKSFHLLSCLDNIPGMQPPPLSAFRAQGTTIMPVLLTSTRMWALTRPSFPHLTPGQTAQLMTPLMPTLIALLFWRYVGAQSLALLHSLQRDFIHAYVLYHLGKCNCSAR